jgi:hypothetical protein
LHPVCGCFFWTTTTTTTTTTTQTPLRRLQLLSDKPINARGTCLDTLCAHLEKELAYRHGERDMVLLHHNFGVEFPNGEKVRCEGVGHELGVECCGA